MAEAPVIPGNKSKDVVNPAYSGNNPGLERGETFSNDTAPYNNKDRPESYVGRRRAKSPGEDTRVNMESDSPCVYLVIEHSEGFGDKVLIASMSFKTAVSHVQDFARRIEGEIYPERAYLPSAGTVRMRMSDGVATPYRIEPVALY